MFVSVFGTIGTKVKAEIVTKRGYVCVANNHRQNLIIHSTNRRSKERFVRVVDPWSRGGGHWSDQEKQYNLSEKTESDGQS